MKLDEFFSEVLDIKSEALVEKLCEAARIIKVKKGELLIREGESQGNTLFLMEGICRGYDILENGEETTDFFLYRPGEPMTTGHMLHGVAVVNLMAVTDVTYVEIETRVLLRIGEESEELMRLRSRMLMSNLEERVRLKHVMCFSRAKKRYLWFLENYDGLIDVVRHKDIASFLGIEPESLSRIRRQLAAERETSEF